jgi:hypothetical protein
VAFSIKQHDNRPIYVADLVDNADTTPTPINLSTATSVTFKMRTAGAADTNAPTVSRAAQIGTPSSAGRVRHNWTTADTAAIGEYEVEFEILWNDGGVETVPNDGYATINIVEDLDAN